MNPTNNISSRSCVCNDCIYNGPESRRKLTCGSRIDKLYFDKYLPLRERKLLQKLVRTRAVYDDIRNRILSEDEDDDGGVNNDRDSQAIGEFVNLVDRGALPTLQSSVNLHGECCTCCQCVKKAAAIPPNVHKHMPCSNDVDNYISRQKLDTRRYSFNSDSCLCSIKRILKRNRRRRNSKQFGLTQSVVKRRRRKSAYDIPIRSFKCICSNKIRSRKKLKKQISSTISNINYEFVKHRDSMMLHKKRFMKKWACKPGFCVSKKCVPKDCYDEIHKDETPSSDRKTTVRFKGELSKTKDSSKAKKEKFKTKIFCDCKDFVKSPVLAGKEIGKKSLVFSRECEPNMCKPGKCEPSKCADVLLKRTQGAHQLERCLCILRLKKSKLKGDNRDEFTKEDGNEETIVRHTKEKSTQKKKRKLTIDFRSKPNSSLTDVIKKKAVSTTSIDKKKKSLPFPRECGPETCAKGEWNPIKCAEILMNEGIPEDPSLANKQLHVEPIKEKKSKKKNPKSKAITCECSKSSASMTDEIKRKSVSTTFFDKKKNFLPFPRECNPDTCAQGQWDPIKCAEILMNEEIPGDPSLANKKLEGETSKVKKSKKIKPKSKVLTCECSKSNASKTDEIKRKSVSTTFFDKKNIFLPFPRECDQDTCAQGQWNPIKCAEILMNEGILEDPSLANRGSQGEPTKEKKSKKIKLKSKVITCECSKSSASMTDEIKRKSDSTTFLDKKKKSLPFPRECDPHTCAQGQWNPIKCAEILKNKGMLEDPCFCNKQLQVEPIKEKKSIKKNPKSKVITCECSKSSASMTDEIKRKSVSTTFLDKKKKSLPFPRECDPDTCAQGQWNPIKCAEILMNEGILEDPSLANKRLEGETTKEKKSNKKKPKSKVITCECSKSSASMTDEIKRKPVSTMFLVKKKKSLPFPRECDPDTCAQGQWNPIKCAEILMNEGILEDPCFCNKQLKIEPIKENKPKKKEELKSKVITCECFRASASMTDATKRKSVSTTFLDSKNNQLLFSQECDPETCAQAKWNPIKCAEILMNKPHREDPCFCNFQLKDIENTEKEKKVKPSKEKESQTKKPRSKAVRCDCPKSNTSINFPRECDFDTCVLGDWDPKKCAQILINESTNTLPQEPCFCFLQSKNTEKPERGKKVKSNKKKILRKKETKLQLALCECSKSSSSGTDKIIAKTNSTSLKRAKNVLVFSRECDPTTCALGEWDPIECAEILMKETQSTLRLNKASLQKRKAKSKGITCDCSKSSASMTDASKVKICSTSLDKKNNFLQFPREYGPETCTQGEWNPIKCAEILMNRGIPQNPCFCSKKLYEAEKIKKEKKIATKIVKKTRKKKHKSIEIMCNCSKSSVSMTDVVKVKTGFTAMDRTNKSLPFPRECDTETCVLAEWDATKCAEILKPCFCTFQLKNTETTEKEKKVCPKIEKKSRKKESKSKAVKCDCSKSSAPMTDAVKVKNDSTSLRFPRDCDLDTCALGEWGPTKYADILMNEFHEEKPEDPCFCTLKLKNTEIMEKDKKVLSTKDSKVKKKIDICECSLTDVNKERTESDPVEAPKSFVKTTKDRCFCTVQFNYKTGKRNKEEKVRQRKEKKTQVICQCSKSSASMTSAVKVNNGSTLLPFSKEYDRLEEWDPMKCANILINESYEEKPADPCFCTLKLKNSEKIKIDKKVLPTKDSKVKKKVNICECSLTDADKERTEFDPIVAQNAYVKTPKNRCFCTLQFDYKTGKRKKEEKARQSKEKKTQVIRQCSKSSASMTDVVKVRNVFTSLPFPRKCDPDTFALGEWDAMKCAKIQMNEYNSDIPEDRCFCTKQSNKMAKIKKENTSQKRQPNIKAAICMCINKLKSLPAVTDTAKSRAECYPKECHKIISKECPIKISKDRCYCTKQLNNTQNKETKLKKVICMCINKLKSSPAVTDAAKGIIECDPMECVDILSQTNLVKIPEKCFCTLQLNKTDNDGMKNPKLDNHLKHCFCTLDLKEEETNIPKSERPYKLQKKETLKLTCNCKSMPTNNGNRTQANSTMSLDLGKHRNCKHLSFLESDPPICTPVENYAPKCADMQLKNLRCFCTLNFRYKGKAQEENVTKKAVPIKTQTDKAKLFTKNKGVPEKMFKSVQIDEKKRNNHKKIQIVSISDTLPPKRNQTRKFKQRKPSTNVCEQKSYLPKSKSLTIVNGRRGVRFSSSFTFNIDFFREKNYPDSEKPLTTNKSFKDLAVSVANEHDIQGQKVNISNMFKCVCDKIFKKDDNSKTKSICIQTKETDCVCPLKEFLPNDFEPNLCNLGLCNTIKCQERVRQRSLLKRCFCKNKLK